MAGFFGLFNYEKEGPGIEKDAPKKKAFIVFFETFFRNIWKFISVNAVYLLLSIPIVTSGLANVGITNVTRNIARDKHSFMVSDFFDTVKKNWKQATIVTIINTIAYLIAFFALRFYYLSQGKFAIVGTGICLAFLIIFSFMNFFIWTLMITFNFSVKQLYSNSFKFAFINLPKNLICGISLLAVYALNVALLFLFSKAWLMVLLIEILIAILTLPSFRFLLIQFCTFGSIKKFIIDPYYKEHPFEDIQKRKDLGLQIEEEIAEETEDSEETEDFEEIDSIKEPEE